jgi:formamidopyrimidine-DNA glycosylase
MPELPEVETVRRALIPRLVGRTIEKIDQRCEKLRIPLPSCLDARLSGRRIISVDRRAKYLLFRLDNGLVLLLHLGMSGRLTLSSAIAQAAGRHDHVIFHFNDDTRLTFTDTRRFGLVTLAADDDLDNHPLLAGLGLEPFDESFTGQELATRISGRLAPIKTALLDQRVVAGMGNIYACESLYYAGLSPRRSAATVSGRRAERLAASIRQVLSAAIEAGGSSLRDYAGTSGELGYFQHQFAVYNRAGNRCPNCDCGGTIRRIRQSGRSTFYCPRRQR